MSYSCTDYRLTTIPIRLTMRLCFRLNQCTRRYLRGNSASKPMSWAAIFTCRASNTQSHQFLNVPQYHESITEHHSTSQYDIISHQIISWCISYESCICIYIVRLRQSRLSHLTAHIIIQANSMGLIPKTGEQHLIENNNINQNNKQQKKKQNNIDKTKNSKIYNTKHYNNTLYTSPHSKSH